MKTARSLVDNYSAADAASIAFAWNGQRGEALSDANLSFRRQVLAEVFTRRMGAQPSALDVTVNHFGESQIRAGAAHRHIARCGLGSGRGEGVVQQRQDGPCRDG